MFEQLTKTSKTYLGKAQCEGGHEGGADGWAPIPGTSTSPYTGDRMNVRHGDKSKKCIWVNTVEPDLGPVIQTTEGSFVGTIP